MREIDETIDRYRENPELITEDITDFCYGLNVAKGIIRKYMSDDKCSECSRRKWYQKGLEDGSKYNGGWFSVEKILPERIGKWQGDCYEVTIILNGRYLVTTAAYDHGEKKMVDEIENHRLVSSSRAI